MLADEPATWKSEELAASIGTTSGFLSQVLAPLVRAGWVQSAFGPSGGYRYAAPASPPSLLEVIVAIEGPLHEDDCVLHNGTRCAIVSGGPVCALHQGWLRAREALLDVLGSTSALATAPRRTAVQQPAASLSGAPSVAPINTTVPAQAGR